MRKLPHTAAEDFLEIIMRRYERFSTLLTSNRPVEDWGKLPGDVAAVSAMLDRLLHLVTRAQARPEKLAYGDMQFQVRGRRIALQRCEVNLPEINLGQFVNVDDDCDWPAVVVRVLGLRDRLPESTGVALVEQLAILPSQTWGLGPTPGIYRFAPEWQSGLRGGWRRPEPFQPLSRRSGRMPLPERPPAGYKYSCSGSAPLAGFEVSTEGECLSIPIYRAIPLQPLDRIARLP